VARQAGFEDGLNLPFEKVSVGLLGAEDDCSCQSSQQRATEQNH
jgi:hypothetical protein